jgi:hypothetical protein
MTARARNAANTRAAGAHVVSIGLSAAVVAVSDETPRVLVVHHPGQIADSLPFGPFDPLHHRTLESGLRSWVGEQTYIDLGYVEQLYTFGDRGRHLLEPGEGARVVSVGYLALTRGTENLRAPDTVWRNFYHFFPWEDWRERKPPVIDTVIAPALKAFAKSAPRGPAADARRDRVRVCFGFDGIGWDEEKVLERYELLYEAGLVEEAARDGRIKSCTASAPLGESMMFDHRRILATALARLRGKLKYRPVVFELMPPEFTLLELQRTVEAISGVRLHKQNFRRLVEDQGLVEGTGRTSAPTRGRPAELFRFRRDVLRERPAPGFRVGARARG